MRAWYICTTAMALVWLGLAYYLVFVLHDYSIVTGVFLLIVGAPVAVAVIHILDGADGSAPDILDNDLTT